MILRLHLSGLEKGLDIYLKKKGYHDVRFNSERDDKGIV